MYQAIYRCRLCGEIIENEILTQPHVAYRIMRKLIYENEESLGNEPHPVHRHDFHNCKDGSFGYMDFQGFRKTEVSTHG